MLYLFLKCKFNLKKTSAILFCSCVATLNLPDSNSIFLFEAPCFVQCFTHNLFVQSMLHFNIYTIPTPPQTVHMSVLLHNENRVQQLDISCLFSCFEGNDVHPPSINVDPGCFMFVPVLPVQLC